MGLNCRAAHCMVIHPSEMHMIYAVGSVLVVKSVESEADRYLRGHSALVTFVTVSKSGSLMASGEQFNLGSEE